MFLFNFSTEKIDDAQEKLQQIQSLVFYEFICFTETMSNQRVKKAYAVCPYALAVKELSPLWFYII